MDGKMKVAVTDGIGENHMKLTIEGLKERGHRRIGHHSLCDRRS